MNTPIKVGYEVVRPKDFKTPDGKKLYQEERSWFETADQAEYFAQYLSEKYSCLVTVEELATECEVRFLNGKVVGQ